MYHECIFLSLQESFITIQGFQPSWRPKAIENDLYSYWLTLITINIWNLGIKVYQLSAQTLSKKNKNKISAT